MAKVELTRRRILGGAITIGAGAAAAGAGTFALFSDSETSGEDLSSGTVNLQTGSSNTLSFTATDIVPTDSGASSVDLDDSSDSVASDLTIEVTTLTSTEGTNSNEGELDDQLELDLWIGPDSGTDTTRESGDIVLNPGGKTTATDSSAHWDTAVDYQGASWSDVFSGDPFSGPVTFNVAWRFPDLGSTNNNAKNDDISIEFTFTLEQQ